MQETLACPGSAPGRSLETQAVGFEKDSSQAVRRWAFGLGASSDCGWWWIDDEGRLGRTGTIYGHPGPPRLVTGLNSCSWRQQLENALDGLSEVVAG